LIRDSAVQINQFYFK